MTWKKVMPTEAFSKAIPVRLTIKCRIDEFESLMAAETKEMLYSEGVSSVLAPRAIWKWEVHPNDVDWGHDESFFYFNLTGPMADQQEILEAEYLLYFQLEEVRADGRHIDLFNCGTYKFGTDECYWVGSYIEHNRVRRALHENGSLVVGADIKFHSPDGNEAGVISESALQSNEILPRWAGKFFSLYNEQAFSDCSIEIGGISIPAHKSILAAHSPIFRAMFTNPLAEEFQTGVIKVTDFKYPEPMRAVVRYCYQGYLAAETMKKEWAVEIFQLADRYCITGLKDHLENHFVSTSLCAKNVVAMAVLADMHGAAKLKKASNNLIVSEGSAVFEIEEWKELSDGELIKEVFQLADKYSTPELKAQLQKHIIAKRLNVGNVAEMAVLAETHSAGKLKEGCIKLIAREQKTIFESAAWKELKDANAKLVAQLLVGVRLSKK